MLCWQAHEIKAGGCKHHPITESSSEGHNSSQLLIDFQVFLDSYEKLVEGRMFPAVQFNAIDNFKRAWCCWVMPQIALGA